MFDLTATLEIYFGLLLMLSALAIVVNRYSFEQVLGDIEKNHLAVLLAGAGALFVGLLTVTNVEYDRFSAKVLLLVIGWISVIKGAMIFLVPNWLIRIGHAAMKSKQLHTMAIFSFVLGSILLLLAFDVIS